VLARAVVQVDGLVILNDYKLHRHHLSRSKKVMQQNKKLQCSTFDKIVFSLLNNIPNLEAQK
jgi:hypothetical protein